MGEGVKGGLPAPAWLAAAPLVFVLLWSTGFIVAKYAAPHAPPLTFLLYRFAGAIAILLPIIAVTRAPWPRTASKWRDVAIVGVLLQATYLGGVWVAIALGMPAGVSALLVGAQPLLTAGLVFTVGERASRLQWAGLIVGFAGIALVLSDRLTLAGVTLPALAVNFLALAGITVGTLYQKKHVADVDLRTGSLIQFAASFVVLLPFAITTESMRVDFTIEFWLALAWSIVALSLGGDHAAARYDPTWSRHRRDKLDVPDATSHRCARLAAVRRNARRARLGRLAGHDGGGGVGADNGRA